MQGSKQLFCRLAQENKMKKISYSMEELLPAAAKLTQKYTSGESTSVTYERAESLMEAVIYCIREYEEGLQEAGTEEAALFKQEKKLPSWEAYQKGYERVVEKVKETSRVYNEMILEFNAYGNENYYDTVTKGIPSFFKWYDARFTPQDHVITMDYPVLRSMEQWSGIDALSRYVEAIELEQSFLKKMPEGYLCQVLAAFDRDYRKQFINISRIILRHILGCMAVGKSMGEKADGEDYKKLCEFVKAYEKEELEEILLRLLDGLVRKQYGGKEQLFSYLSCDIKDFTAELRFGAQNGSLEKVVALQGLLR